VAVNGTKETDPDRWIDLELDRVTLDGTPVARQETRYILLHKPAGYLTTYNHPKGRATVFDLIPGDLGYLFPVGRLDLDTSGLLILTNDSAFAERVTNPEFHVPKTYRVQTASAFSDEQLQRLRDGVDLEDGPTRPAEVTRGDGAIFELTITEGRNRQVRRMIDAAGGEVMTLVRVAIGSVKLDRLETGQWRELTSEEVTSLLAPVDLSSP
jgi:pseudouridine synthase